VYAVPSLPVPAANDGSGGDDGAVKADPEARGRLARAEQFVQEGQYAYAAIVWQAVIDESGDSWIESERAKDAYVPLRHLVETTIARADPEAREAYRQNADGEARAMLARTTPANEREVLTNVVRRFFMSSLGDDAACRLGGLALDQGDFLTAIRMFSRTLEEHPDPDVSRGDLALRLAVATARAGDPKQARDYLDAIDPAAPAAPARQTLAMVSRIIEQITAAHDTASPTGSWPMAGGSSSRRGAMAAIELAAGTNLTDKATFQFDLVFPPSGVNPQLAMYGIGRQNPGDATVSRESLVARWREKGWRPAGAPLLQEGRIYVKTPDDLVCIDSEHPGRGPLWRTAWRNDYTLDSRAVWMAAVATGNPQMAAALGERPRNAAEAFFFDDRVHHSLSIIGDTIYTLEGRRRSRLGADESAGPGMSGGMIGGGFRMVPRSSRLNWLAAFDARTGKARWRRDAADETAPPVEPPIPTEPDTDSDVTFAPIVSTVVPSPAAGSTSDEPGGGFLAAPVECGGLLVVPVAADGAVFLCGLSPTDGSTRWRTRLCDEPAAGSSPSTPAGVSIEGQTAYVVCGSGAVFAVDATSGERLWTKRYPRQQKPQSPTAIMWGRQTNVEYDGWDDDVAIPLGRHLVVMASDSDWLFAVDRRTGAFLWQSPRVSPFGHAAEYYLGSIGRRLFVAGRGIVRGYDIPSGRLVWESTLDSSHGRGCVTADAILVPAKDSVLMFDPETGKPQGRLGISLVSGDPLGNLFSDGKRLWTLSANRLHELGLVEDQLKSIQKRIDAGDESAWSDRARVHARGGDWEKAMSDVRSQHACWKAGPTAETALPRTLALATSLEAPSRRPIDSLRLAVDLLEAGETPAAAGVAGKPGPAAEAFEAFASEAIRALEASPDPAAVADVWRAARWSARPRFQRRLSLLLAKIAASSSGVPDWLTARTTSESDVERALAATVLARLPAAGKDAVQTLTADRSDVVRLAAVRGTLWLGEKQHLPAVAALLASDDESVRSAAFATLRSVTRAALPFDAAAAAEVRGTQCEAWKTWMETELPKAELALPLHDDGLRGITLIVNAARNQLVELDDTGRVIRRIQTAPGMTAAFAFPDGRKVAMYGGHTLIQFLDDSGKAIARHQPGDEDLRWVHVGNDGTAVAAGMTGTVYEIDASSLRVLWKSDGSRPFAIRRLETGSTLIALLDARHRGGKIIEIDRQGKTVWEAAVPFRPTQIDPSADGSTWVLEHNSNRIHEIGADGRERSVYDVPLTASRVQSFQRLPDGNILIADGQAVREYDPRKKVVWSFDEPGAIHASRY
jgi:outer membrane protein assembly factor BamB/tetratricopeptide (TPR) repeat protein